LQSDRELQKDNLPRQIEEALTVTISGWRACRLHPNRRMLERTAKGAVDILEHVAAGLKIDPADNHQDAAGTVLDRLRDATARANTAGDTTDTDTGFPRPERIR
jgi:hypothetical protein